MRSAFITLSHVLSVCILICLCLPGSGARAGQTRHYDLVYISPLPNSKYLHPGTNIILRAATRVAGSDAPLLVRTITGGRSGLHSFTTHISDDCRTVTFQPEVPFASAEEVTVQIDTNEAVRIILDDQHFDGSIFAHNRS